MSFVPTKFLKYQQYIERNGPAFFNVKIPPHPPKKKKKNLSSLAPLARIYISSMFVGIMSFILQCHTISILMKGNCIDCILYADVIGDLKYMYVSEIKYLNYQQEY